MDLSPNDIRNYEFPNQMRGYDKEAVDNFLDQVAAALENAKQENLKLSMQIESLGSQLSGLKQFEDTIKSAAIDARRNADMTIATAKQESEMILSKAKSGAENIMVARTKEVSEIENQITRLGLTKKSYMSKIRAMIQSHLEMIDEIDTDEGAATERAEDIRITQSTDVTTEQRESLADQQDELDSDGEGVEDAMADDLKKAIRADEDESAPEPVDDKPIDPELAEALENYKKTTAGEGAPEETTTPAPAAAPPQDAIVETTARAEDIPDGFIAQDGNSNDVQSGEAATDKALSDEPDTQSEAEPDAPGTDRPQSAPVEPLEPDGLAGELDEVAAKFEEAMDKADSK